MHLRLILISFLRRFIGVLKTRLGRVHEELKLREFMTRFGERNDDIYIASYPKSGTTWMQMILYQMTTEGSMHFEHLYDVSPWPKYASIKNSEPLDLPSPRILKTHDAYGEMFFGKTMRIIFVIRDGLDVAASFYEQHKNIWDQERKFDDHFRFMFVEDQPLNWFSFVDGWLDNKKERNILFVHYADLKRDLGKQVMRIADFVGIDSSTLDLERIRERTSFKYMQRHEEKFTIRPPQGRTRESQSQLVRKGDMGSGENYCTPARARDFRKMLRERLGHHRRMKRYLTE